MEGIRVVNSREKPYPHDYLIDKLFLWAFPKTIKPNHITIFRFLATPFVFIFVALNWWSIALPLFIFVAFTDALDGSMARVRKQVTSWGTLFDPVADKLLIGGVIFILILKYIDIYIGAAIIVLELAVIIAGVLNKKKGIIVSASSWGKSKMFLQVSGLALLLLSLLVENSFIMIIAEWTLILSLIFALLNIMKKEIGM